MEGNQSITHMKLQYIYLELLVKMELLIVDHYQAYSNVQATAISEIALYTPTFQTTYLEFEIWISGVIIIRQMLTMTP